MTQLIDMVDFLFSKNAGPYLITFDIMFKDREAFQRAWDSGTFTKESMAELYKVSVDRILSIYAYPAGRAIKFSMIREISSGDFGDRSVFGSQYWAPLIDYEIPDPM